MSQYERCAVQAPVKPRGMDSLMLWNWLANEARAVLEVDGAL